MHLKILSLLLMGTLIVNVAGDCFLHTPRGSNNRLNGRNRARANNNRMFNSQNNNRGGYNVGKDKMRYHVGSILNIEWTNQHSCSGPNNNCDLVIQYMCGDKVRDGTSTSTIPDNVAYDTSATYGMHEDHAYYTTCKQTSRNKRLFLSDQELNGDTAIYTRQNNAGARSAFECPEERDYYPYWRSTPWKDIAILTSDESKCETYLAESENVKGRYFCFIDTAKASNSLKNKLKALVRPITKEDCEAFQLIEGQVCLKGKWVQNPSHQEDNSNIKAPECLVAPQTRDNHNGNGYGGFPITYKWIIPDDVHDKCVLRIRYNITTGDYPVGADSDSNGKYEVADQVGITDKEEAKNRNYLLTGNPNIRPLKVNGAVNEKFELKLAINTAQFGRTFQDRSFVFSIIPRPSDIPATTPIYNLNVRGKRGNIVQTYPAVEYDFVPNRLHLNKGDAVHIQWNGADTNPNNNAGQGTAGTDRHNMVQLTGPQYDGVKNALADKPNKFGHWGNSYPDHLNPAKFLGFTLADRKLLAYNVTQGTDPTGLLNKAKAYFDMGVRTVNKIGSHRYFCTRNNAFTNRGQKAVVIVKEKKAETNTVESKRSLDNVVEDLKFEQQQEFAMIS